MALLESRTDIAVLFTDINMPGSMDGLKLAHAVRGRWPPVKIIMVSGQVRLTASELPSDSKFFRSPTALRTWSMNCARTDRSTLKQRVLQRWMRKISEVLYKTG